MYGLIRQLEILSELSFGAFCFVLHIIYGCVQAISTYRVYQLCDNLHKKVIILPCKYCMLGQKESPIFTVKVRMTICLVCYGY